jgi:hypothetical protein
MAKKDPTLYEILGVRSSATAGEIKAAQKKLNKQYHPDTNRDDPDAARMCAEANAAADLLLDPDKRAEYDASLPAVFTITPTTLDFGVLQPGGPPVAREVVFSWQEDRPPSSVDTPVTKGSWWSVHDAPMAAFVVTYILHAQAAADLEPGIQTSNFELVVDGVTRRVRLTARIPKIPSSPSSAGSDTPRTDRAAAFSPPGSGHSGHGTTAPPTGGSAATSNPVSPKKSWEWRDLFVLVPVSIGILFWVFVAIFVVGLIIWGIVSAVSHHSSGVSNGAVIAQGPIRLDNGWGINLSGGSTFQDPYGTASDLSVYNGSLRARSSLTGPYTNRPTFQACVNATEQAVNIEPNQQTAVSLQDLQAGDYLCAYTNQTVLALLRVAGEITGSSGNVTGIVFDVTLWQWMQ